MAYEPVKVDKRRKTVRNPQGAGRPSILSDEVQAEFFNNRSMGLSFDRAAKLAGVSSTSVKNWRATGETALAKPISKRTPHEQKCVTFVTALEKIDSEWLRRCEIVLNFSLSPGQNKKTWEDATQAERSEATATAKWKLSHQAPEEYSTQTRTELTGADGGPVEIDPTGMDVFNILLKVKKYEETDDA